MLYRKSQSLKFLAALAVGTLAIVQVAPANAKPMQSGTSQPTPENQSFPTRMNTQNRNNTSETTDTPPAGANVDTRPTQSDGSRTTNPTDRRIYQNNQMSDDMGDDQNTPPAGANVDTRPTQSDGSRTTNPTDRRIYQNNNRTTTPNTTNQTRPNTTNQMNRSK